MLPKAIHSRTLLFIFPAIRSALELADDPMAKKQTNTSTFSNKTKWHRQYDDLSKYNSFQTRNTMVDPNKKIEKSGFNCRLIR